MRVISELVAIPILYISVILINPVYYILNGLDKHRAASNSWWYMWWWWIPMLIPGGVLWAVGMLFTCIAIYGR